MADVIRDNVMPSAPPGLGQVHLGGGATGAEANELAAAVAMKKFAAKNGVASMSALCVVGFDNSNHGTTTGTLSFSSAGANPDGLPAFPWPKAEFPKMKYPFAMNEKANAQEEDRCVQVLKDIITGQRDAGVHVSAVFIEPMSAIGQEMATPNFYRKIRALTRDEGVAFIVDETKTSMGSSGKNWAHEYWYLGAGDEPDMVTFGGKSGIGGFFSNNECRLSDEESFAFPQNVNMQKLLHYGRTQQLIEEGDLLHLQNDTASFLKIELGNVGKHTGLVNNVRGYGTHLAFEVEDGDLMQKFLLRNGINVGKCGPNTLALRPSLMLGCFDAAHLRDCIKHYHPNFVLNYQ